MDRGDIVYQDKKLLWYSIIGFIFVSIAGVLLHFAYDWTGNNPFVGLFATVNESTWEHMKLLFFPMLVFQAFQCLKLKDTYPGIFCGGLYATIISTFSIPVLFYGYQAILGETNAVVNISIFFISVLIGMIWNYLLATRAEGNCRFIIFLTILLIMGFFFFTSHPPKGILFQEPYANTCGI